MSATKRCATLMVAAWPDGSENPLPQSGQLLQPAPELVSTTNAPLIATRYVAITAMITGALTDAMAPDTAFDGARVVPTVVATTAT